MSWIEDIVDSVGDWSDSFEEGHGWLMVIVLIVLIFLGWAFWMWIRNYL